MSRFHQRDSLFTFRNAPIKCLRSFIHSFILSRFHQRDSLFTFSIPFLSVSPVIIHLQLNPQYTHKADKAVPFLPLAADRRQESKRAERLSLFKFTLHHYSSESGQKKCKHIATFPTAFFEQWARIRRNCGLR